MMAQEDLMAFEKRLTEIVETTKPAARSWRVVFYMSVTATLISAYFWISDPITFSVPIRTSLLNNPVFSISLVVLLVLFLTGITRRMNISSIIINRCREVLADFNISCDDRGKLILHPIHNHFS